MLTSTAVFNGLASVRHFDLLLLDRDSSQTHLLFKCNKSIHEKNSFVKINYGIQMREICYKYYLAKFVNSLLIGSIPCPFFVNLYTTDNLSHVSSFLTKYPPVQVSLTCLQEL